MVTKKKTKTVTKVKKKKWFPIFAPQQFQGAQLGETFVGESGEMATKFLTANLSTITRSMRKQNINIHFKMDRVEDGKAYTTIIGYSLVNAAMKRLVRRGRDKVTDSFLAKTKDKKVIRVKPLIITFNKGTKSTQSAVRLETRRVVREHFFSKTVEEVFADIISGTLQKLIKEHASKFYPLKAIEIRNARLELKSNVVVTDKEVKTEKVKRRVKDKGNRFELDEPKPVEQQPDYVPDDGDSSTSSGDDNTEDFGDDLQQDGADDQSVDDSNDEFDKQPQQASSKSSSKESSDKNQQGHSNSSVKEKKEE